MPELNTFQIDVIAGEHTTVNGRVQRRVVLTVNGEQKLAERMTLDSQLSVAKCSNRWCQTYGIDADAVAERLRKLNIEIIAEETQRRKRLQHKPGRPRCHLSTIADEFVKGLTPLWHRKARKLFIEREGREVAITDLWAFATDDDINAVAGTAEAADMGRNGGPPNFRARLLMFKDAVRMAAERLLRTLRENTDVESDATLDRDELVHKLVAVLIRPRTFKLDVDSVSVAYFDWATSVRVGSGVQKCYSHPVYARRDDTNAHPTIAISGDHLTGEIHYKSRRKLAADLTSTGLADVGKQWWIPSGLAVTAGKNLRVWVLEASVLDEIATYESTENGHSSC